MEAQSQEPTTTAVQPTTAGPLVVLGLPFAVQILTMYVLLAVETPLTPWVNKVMTRRMGVVMLAGMGMGAVCVVMMIVLGIIEWRHKRRNSSEASHER